jgi:class 3 adenylate cyclase/Tfp pilus assembly protein PilF
MDQASSTSDVVLGAPSGRKLIAVVYMDMVGYSRFVGLDDIGTIRQLRVLRQALIDPTVYEHGGKIVQTAGDSLLIVFDSIGGAISCAIKIQQEVPFYDGEHLPGQRMRFRIGVDIADVIAVGTELHGNGVNVAARLQAECTVGGICVSRAVRDHVRNRPDLGFEELGTLRLKNIDRPVEAFLLRFGHPRDPTDGNQSGMDTGLAPAARPAWRGIAYGVLKMVGGAALLLPLMSSVASWRSTPHDHAERLLGQALSIGCPQNPCPREWLAKRALFEQAITVDPTFARAYAEATFTYTNFITSHISVDRNEDLRIAARLATQAVALAPDKAFAHVARAAVLRQDPDKLEDALSAYLRALAIEPMQPPVRANAGWMLVLLGRPAEGKPYLETALAMAPHHLYAAAWLNYLGLAELFLGRYGEATDLFRGAIETQSHGAIAADIELERGLNLAAALALDGKVVAAREVIDGLRSRHPSLSTHNILWNCDCSHAPGFLAGLATLRRGVALAGVLDTG